MSYTDDQYQGLKAEQDSLKVAIIELQQEINCLRMEPCQLPACVKDRDRLRAELAFAKEWKELGTEKGRLIDKIFSDRDKWREMAGKLAESARVIDGLLCFEDKIYDVREREGEGWEGPKVTTYGKACIEFKEALTAYDSLAGEGKDMQSKEKLLAKMEESEQGITDRKISERKCSR